MDFLGSFFNIVEIMRSYPGAFVGRLWISSYISEGVNQEVHFQSRRSIVPQ